MRRGTKITGGIALFAALLIAWPTVQGQMQHPQGDRPMMGEMRHGMDREAMMERCRQMMHHMRQMRERMEQMNEELEERLEALEEAEGEERINAMEEAVQTLLRQRLQMHEQRQEMMHGMMRHMGEHMMMEGDQQERGRMMMRCPMMQSGAMEDGPRPDRRAGQRAHH